MLGNIVKSSRRYDGLARRFVSLLRTHFRNPQILEQIRNAQKQRINIVYVLRRPSTVRTALLRAFCVANDLPEPDTVIDASSSVLPVKPFCSTLYLRRRAGHELTPRSTKRFRERVVDKLSDISQDAIGSDTLYVPVTIFAGLGPRPWPGTAFFPFDFDFLAAGELWQLFVVWFHRNSLTLDIGPALIFTNDQPPVKRRHILSKELYKKDKLARGAIARDPQSIENIVLSGEQMERVIDQVAIATSSTRDQIYHRAQNILSEIAASHNQGVIVFFRFFLTFLIKRLFTRVELHNLEEIRAAASEHPVILLPCHRSHFDYLILSYVLYFAHLPLPYIAAGANLNFFPAGPLLRASGGFFIRRKIEKDLLYKAVLDRYLTYLVKAGHMIEFYVEGGRSRSGLTLPPQLGLLKSLVRSYKRGDRQEMLIVPTSITYETVAEEESFANEQLGSEKHKENFLQLLRAGGLFFRKLGPVVVHFGTPISLREFSKQPLSKDVASSQTLSMLTEDVGYAAAREMIHRGALTVSALTASTMMTLPHYRGEEEVVAFRMLHFIKILAISRGVPREVVAAWEARQISLSELLPEVACSSRVQEFFENNLPQYACKAILRNQADEGFINSAAGSTVSYSMTEDTRVRSELYKNALLGHLVNPALVIASVLGENNRLRYHLHQIFKTIFILPHWQTWEGQAIVLQQHLETAGILRRNEVRNEAIPTVVLLKPYLDAIDCSLSLVAQMDRLAESEFLSRLKSSLGDRPFSRTETQASSFLQFALKFLVREGLVSSVAAAKGLSKNTTRKRERYVVVREKVSTGRSSFRDAVELQAFKDVVARLATLITERNNDVAREAADSSHQHPH